MKRRPTANTGVDLWNLPWALTSPMRPCEVNARLYYWRERNQEVDIVIQAGTRLASVEVKSGRAPAAHPGTAAFVQAFHAQRPLLVGGDGISLLDFLTQPLSRWME